MDGTDVLTTALNAQAHDLSLWGLFLQAHIVVKIVMIGLIIASVWCWGIVIDKWLLFARNKKAMDRFERVFWSGQSLEELYHATQQRSNTTMASVFVAAMREWKRSHERNASSMIGLQTRIDKVMDVTIARESERMERSLLVLASVGSAGPFIGLFGTVWGIMTALGLVAAIPATIFYNKFVNDVSRQTTRMEGFADEFSAILSRQIDERASSIRQAAQ